MSWLLKLPATALRTYGARGIAQRATYELQHRAGVLRRQPPRGLGDPIPGFALPTTFDLAGLRQVYRSIHDAAAIGEEARSRAERIVAGEQLVYSHLWAATGWPPDWHVAPSTGAEWPRDAHWSEIADDGSRGDIKDVWELSRFPAVPMLLRAAAAAGDDHLIVRAFELVEDWARANPPARGVQWVNGQEAAIRGMVVQLLLLAGGESATDDQRAVLGGLLRYTVWRVEQTLGYALSQRNNHAINEAAFLWTMAALLGDAPSIARWGRVLDRCIRDQFYEDGGYAQHSFTYHRLALHCLLWIRRVAALVGRPPPVELASALERSFNLLSELLPTQADELPNTGSNDGALLFPLTGCDYRDARPLLQSLSLAVTGQRALEPGPWDEEALWLVGTDLPEAVRSPERSEVHASTAGFATVRGERSFGLLRVPKYRHRPSQADELHFDVWIDGVNIAPDPGTYRYMDAPPWRNGLAGRAVHNSLFVEGAEAKRLGRFFAAEWPDVRVIRREVGDDSTLVVAEVGLPDGVGTHRRGILRIGETLTVADLLIEGGDATVHWNLAADAPNVSETEFGDARLDVGVAWVEVNGAAGVDLLPAASASRDSVRGWFSGHYAHREPMTTLRLTVAEGQTVITTFVPKGETDPSSDAVQRLLGALG